MIRAPMGDKKFWDHWIEFQDKTIRDTWETTKTPSKNPVYEPQYVFNITYYSTRLILRRYSRGDAIADLAQHFPGLLDAWELSNKLATDICQQKNIDTCRDWHFTLSDLNHYNWCFWLVGLALSLDIPDEQWQRLLVLIGGEGDDELLDRIIASRQPNRTIGKKVLHKKPYARLLKAIDAPEDKQVELLKEFVLNWYPELARKGKKALWWYDYGHPEKHPLDMGSYFGRWCIEAVAAVKAFNLDDSLCLGHEHYPGDLLRPEGPTTHPVREEKKSLLKRWFDYLCRCLRFRE